VIATPQRCPLNQGLLMADQRSNSGCCKEASGNQGRPRQTDGQQLRRRQGADQVEERSAEESRRREVRPQVLSPSTCVIVLARSPGGVFICRRLVADSLIHQTLAFALAGSGQCSFRCERRRPGAVLVGSRIMTRQVGPAGTVRALLQSARTLLSAGPGRHRSAGLQPIEAGVTRSAARGGPYAETGGPQAFGGRPNIRAALRALIAIRIRPPPLSSASSGAWNLSTGGVIGGPWD
jgi:hypothetical protein